MTTQEIIEHFRSLPDLRAEALIGKEITEEVIDLPRVSSSYSFGLIIGAIYALQHLNRVEITADELRRQGITIAAGER